MEQHRDLPSFFFHESPRDLQGAAQCLLAGEKGVLPTDTLYGLLANAFSPRAVEDVYYIKRRNEHKPCIVLLSQWKDLELFGRRWRPYEKEILQNGIGAAPVSVLLPFEGEQWKYLHRGTNMVAFRVPTKKWLQKLLSLSGPCIAPSANREGEAPVATCAEARKLFGEEIALFADGGTLSGKPSLLIELQENRIVERRSGAWTLSYLADFLRQKGYAVKQEKERSLSFFF